MIFEEFFNLSGLASVLYHGEARLWVLLVQAAYDAMTLREANSGTVIRTLLPLQGAQVPALVVELRSHSCTNWSRRKKKKEKRERQRKTAVLDDTGSESV